jgi:hypothetical protein
MGKIYYIASFPGGKGHNGGKLLYNTGSLQGIGKFYVDVLCIGNFEVNNL